MRSEMAYGMKLVGTVIASVLGVFIGGTHGWELGVGAAYLMFLLIDIRFALESQCFSRQKNSVRRVETD